VDDIWKIFSPAAGIWALVAMGAVALFKAWPLILEKLNERRRDIEHAKEGDWSRLREEIIRLDDRCDHLQHQVDACHEREAEWMRRAISAEAFLAGEGEARQTAQRIVSAERLVAKPKDKPDG
jgi:hypothetical protein